MHVQGTATISGSQSSQGGAGDAESIEISSNDSISQSQELQELLRTLCPDLFTEQQLVTRRSSDSTVYTGQSDGAEQLLIWQHTSSDSSGYTSQSDDVEQQLTLEHTSSGSTGCKGYGAAQLFTLHRTSSCSSGDTGQSDSADDDSSVHSGESISLSAASTLTRRPSRS